MKKLILTAFVLFTLTGCYKDDLLLPDIKQDLKPELQIANSIGIKLETVFVTKEVSMNVKLEKSGTVTLKIFDIGNRVVSKETGEKLSKALSGKPKSTEHIDKIKAIKRKLLPEDIQHIRENPDNLTGIQLAEKYNSSRASISRIINNKRYVD